LAEDKIKGKGQRADDLTALRWSFCSKLSTVVVARLRLKVPGFGGSTKKV
jgi:hypothetical protein